MKGIKKLSMVLLVCLLVSIVVMPISASAAEKLNKKSITLNVGKTYTLKTTGTKGKITWSSNNKKVAIVSQKGVVKAIKKGTATINAKYGKKKLTCKVTVKQPVTSIKLNKKSASITVGKKVTLKATVFPQNANNKNVVWKSSNTAVATVSSKGIVTGKKSGTVTITVTAKDGSKKRATCKIQVKAKPVQPTQPGKPVFSKLKNYIIKNGSINANNDRFVKRYYHDTTYCAIYDSSESCIDFCMYSKFSGGTEVYFDMYIYDYSTIVKCEFMLINASNKVSILHTYVEPEEIKYIGDNNIYFVIEKNNAGITNSYIQQLPNSTLDLGIALWDNILYDAGVSYSNLGFSKY